MVADLPEVPLKSRLELLHYGKSRGAFCAASCGTAEIKEFVRLKGPEACDLIALNQEETAAFADMARVAGAEEAKEAARRVLEKYPHLHLWFTFGAEGSPVSYTHLDVYKRQADRSELHSGRKHYKRNSAEDTVQPGHLE